MESVILMVSCEQGKGIIDLEVMPDIASEELSEAIASAMKLSGVYDIEIVSTGKRLAAWQTLADANVWDGSHIRLVKSSRPPKVASTIVEQPTGVKQQQQHAPFSAGGFPPTPSVPPVIGWRQPEKRDQERK